MIGTSVAVVAALGLGGGGLAMVTNNASAGSGVADGASSSPSAQQAVQQSATTIDCPDVADRLSEVPRRVRPEVDRKLAELDIQIVDAYSLLARNWRKADDATWVKERVLRPLNEERHSTLIRIVILIDRAGERPSGVEQMASCEVKQGGTPAAPAPSADAGATPKADDGQSAPPAQPAQVSGPARSDFVDITKVEPNVQRPRRLRDASTGSFRSRCGRNENGLRNPDNVIVAPGVSNGAHHMHDYVGNQGNTFEATNDSLAAADTTCSNGDQSSYYWPVLRVQNGEREKDANAPGGGIEGNVGSILQPATVSLKFVGSPVGKVVAMPRFLRIITGDAKAFTNGDANANASWSCTGFQNRQLKDKYPLCPEDSKVVRTFRFQSCWDGQNIDSANHRTHVAFADDKGRCPEDFKAIPQLVAKLTYEVPPDEVFAVDGFPEQLHKPITDHDDFINVMSKRLMNKAVTCINDGRRCG